MASSSQSDKSIEKLQAPNSNLVQTDVFELALRDGRKLIEKGELKKAEMVAQDILKLEKNHIEALYLQVIAQRLQGSHSAASKTLSRLQSLSPNMARAYQERGYIWIANKNLNEAVASFEKAVELDSALVGSWNALLGLYGMQNRPDAVRAVKTQFERLKKIPSVLIQVTSLINESKFEQAEMLCRKYLNNNPENVEAMRLLARLGSELGVYDDCEALLKNALAFEPNHELARFDYVGVLIRRQKREEAFHHAQILLDQWPVDHNYQRLYANACTLLGRQEEAITIFSKLLKLEADNHNIYLSLGHLYKTTGQLESAIDSYRNAYLAKTDFGDAYWSLANLKTYQLTDEELAMAKRHEQSENTAVDDRVHFCFALGKAHEDRSQFKQSFAYYSRGNGLRKKVLGYKPEPVTEEFKLQKRVCTAALFEQKKDFGNAASDPIFIVGLPRSGSTLLEQILASHSLVDGTFELPDILSMVRTLNGRRDRDDATRYPQSLHDLSQEEIVDLGQSYLDSTRIHRAAAPYFTDKMPNNFRHIGLIKLILPNAKIIDARRDPMACCFSGFKQHFAEGQGFSYDLEDIGRYYCDYVDLMTHWDSVFPNQILQVKYENVVADLESEVARILEYCNLPMEQACLDFYKTERLVQTPSSEQVRQPINRNGLTQWEPFELFLEPLKRALGPQFDVN
jgi:tetratricopeptide (TPR) repeat protein